MTSFAQRVTVRRRFVALAIMAVLGVGAGWGQDSTPKKEAAPGGGARTTQSPNTVDHYRRTRDWEQVQEYMGEETFWVRTVGHWLHAPENRTKSMEDGAKELGLEKPDSGKAYENALDVMTSDPTDDLGFMAIEFCMKFTAKGEPLYKCTEQALTYLDRYYISDPRMKEIALILARAAGDRGEAILDKVIANGTSRDLRAEAAYCLVEEKHNEVDDATLSAAVRAARREKMLRLAHLADQQYGDVIVWAEKPAREEIKPFLFSLEHLSLGDTIPDMQVQRVDGTKDDLRNYRGKVVLLDYWATWCIPCVQSFRESVGPLKKELQGRPFEVITLSIDQKPAMVDTFTKNVMPLPFVNWFIGMDSPYYRPWGLAGVPHYYLIDKNGVIRANTFEAETLLETARKLAAE
jgi:thiol-disulfide isomerase/thioredoxin